MDASQPTFKRDVTLAIGRSDVGKFIGGAGSFIEHVVHSARERLAWEEALSDGYINLPCVTITTDGNTVVAHCTAQTCTEYMSIEGASEKLLDLVEERLIKHASAVLASGSIAVGSAEHFKRSQAWTRLRPRAAAQSV